MIHDILRERFFAVFNFSLGNFRSHGECIIYKRTPEVLIRSHIKFTFVSENLDGKGLENGIKW